MRNFFQFNLGFVLSVTFLIAICFVTYISPWIILLLAQLLLIRVLAAFLYRGIPYALIKVSRDNCYRMNGIKSPRREARERKARRKIRSDLFAVLIIVALSGDWLVLMLDILVIPLPVAVESLSVFSFDTDLWRNELTSRNLDREYSVWLGLGQFGNTEINEQPNFVKTSFPILIGAAITWVVGSSIFVRYSYQSTIREFCDGTKARSNEYLNLDIGRLQG